MAEAKAKAPKIKYKKNRTNQKPLLENTDRVRHQLKELAKRMCSMKEASAILGISDTTLYDFFKRHPDAKDAWLQGKEIGRHDLREMLWAHAKENPNTAQFLAKQREWLDYGDNKTQDINVNINAIPHEERMSRIKELQAKVIDITPEKSDEH